MRARQASFHDGSEGRRDVVQIVLLVILNLFVGGMVGLERTVLPIVAKQDFGILDKSAAISFIVSFGLVKAVSNLFAGRMADVIGRRRLLILGWVIGMPIPLLVMFASNWGWIVFANVLLGVNQGFCWSMTVNMKIDLAGARYRGLVVGLNEFSGYVAISVTALLSGYIAATYGVRPQPFYLGVAYSLIGLALSVFAIKDTESSRKHASKTYTVSKEQPVSNGYPVSQTNPVSNTNPSLARVFAHTTWRDKQLFAATQAGFMTNFKDGMAWGLLPLFLSGHGLSLISIGSIAAAYPGTWGILQLLTGPLSDKAGRRWLIFIGMLVQGLSILWIALSHDFIHWLLAAILLGLGTAMVYPTLIAAVSDVSKVEWRASSLGVYRFWRDFGYAAGAFVAGLLADLLGIFASMMTVGVLVIASSVVVFTTLQETLTRTRLD